MTVRRSKIRPPHPPVGLLARPGLLARLQQACRHSRVLLLQAPAGYGKTTLLAAAFAAAPPDRPSVWLTFDEGDTLVEWVEALLAALEAFDLDWRLSARRLLAAAAAGQVGTVVDHLASALASAQGVGGADGAGAGAGAADLAGGLLVFDDLQRASDAALQRGIDILIDALPAGWRLCMACRGELPPALARWRLRGELAAFGPRELAFDAQESQARALAHGLRDRSAQLDLARRSRGWPAALRLALAAPASTSAADTSLCDYLAAEVIAQLPAELRDFMLASAVLPELAAERAAAVTGDPLAARHLDEMRRRDLFVSEVDDDGTLRLHELFRQILLQQLQREQPARLAQLLRRAAAGEADPLRRVEWLLRAGDPAAAESELEAASRALITDGAGARVQAVLELFAAPWRASSPRLAIVAAQLAWSRWDAQRMLQVLQAVPAAALQAAAPDLRDVFEAYLAVAFDNAYRHQDCRQQLERLSTRPLAPLPQLLTLLCLPASTPDQAIGLRRRTIAAADRLGTADAWYQAMPPLTLVMLPGCWHDTRHMASTMRRLSCDEPNALRLWSSYLQAWLDLWRGDLGSAQSAIDDAAGLARWDGAPADGLAQIHALAALLHAVRDQRQACERAQRRAREAELPPADPHQGLVHGRQLLAWHARLACVLGDLGALRSALAAWPDDDRGAALLPRLGIARRAAEAAACALEGRLQEAEARWTALLPELPALEGQGEPLELRLRLCALRLRLGRDDAAAQLLAATLDALPGEPGFGPALIAGADVLGRLLAAAPRLGLTQYCSVR